MERFTALKRFLNRKDKTVPRKKVFVIKTPRAEGNENFHKAVKTIKDKL